MNGECPTMLPLQTRVSDVRLRLAEIPILLRSKQSAIDRLIAELPSLPDNHVAALQSDIIKGFATKLHCQVTAEGPTYHRVVELQSGLLGSMGRAIPLMVPLFSKDAAAVPQLRYARGKHMADLAADQSKVYIDDLFKMREQ